MPVEIRELVIRAVAIPEREDVEKMADESLPRQMQNSLDDKDVIIQECVRQVLRILHKEKDR